MLVRWFIKNIKRLMHWSDEVMISIVNFNKNSYISVIFVVKPKNFVVFAFTYVSRSSALFYGDFCMNLTAMKRWSDEGRRLNASLLQILRSIKCFITRNFYSASNASSPLLFREKKSSFNASLLLLFYRDSSLNASSLLLFKVTLPTSGHITSWSLDLTACLPISYTVFVILYF